MSHESPHPVKAVLFVLFTLFALNLTMTGEDKPPAYHCVKAVKSPNIDGVIITWDGFVADDCWKSAVWGENFIIPGAVTPHSEQTNFVVCHDNDNLYFGAVCLKHNAAAVKTDSNKSYMNECVELFITPVGQGANVIQMVFDPSGNSSLIVDGEESSLKEKGAVIAAKIDSDKWVIEASIPWKTLGVPPPTLNTDWSFNVAREHRSKDSKATTLSTWAYLPEPRFMAPDKFIPLKFAVAAHNATMRMPAPLPANAPKAVADTAKPGFILDITEARVNFRGTDNPDQVGKPFASEHIPWANPFAGKPLKVLFIIEIAARDVFEMAERLQMDCADYIMFGTQFGSNNNERPFAYNANKIINRLTGQGDRYDVIVISCAINSQELIDSVKNQVKAGAGLVVFSPRASGGDKDLVEADDLLPKLQPFDKCKDHPVFKNWPIEGLANVNPEKVKDLSEAANKIIKGFGFGTYGKGRVFHLGDCVRWTEGLIPYPYPLYDESFSLMQVFPHWWEHLFSLLVRGICWAGNYAPEIKIDGIAVKNDSTLVVRFADKVPSEMLIDAYWDNRVDTPPPFTGKVTAGTSEIDIPIPAGALRSSGLNGSSLCHVILRARESKSTYDWATQYFTRRSNCTIQKMRPDKEFYDAGEVAQIDLEIANLEKCENPPLALKTILRDIYGRRVSESITPIHAPSMKIPISLSRTIVDRLKLSFLLVDSTNTIVDNKTVKIFVPENTRFWADNFTLAVLTLNDRVYYAQTQDALCADIGVKLSTPMMWNAFSNNGVFFESPHKDQAIAPHQRDVCFNRDSEKISKDFSTVALKGVERNMRLGMLGTYMADEGGISGRSGGYGANGSDPQYDFCYCPACIEGFKRYAREMYKDLDAANREWGTDFKGWDDIKPLPLEETQKREDRNHSLWIDFKLFMEKGFIDCFREAKNVVLSQHPKALLGLTNPCYLGQRTLLSGENYPEWAHEETFQVKYSGSVNSIAYESFSPHAARASWWGYCASMDIVKTEPWWTAFNRINIACWYIANDGAASSTPTWGTNNLFSPYLGHTPRSLALKETAKDLLAGIGKIALDSTPYKREVAMLYSQTSMYVAGAEKKDSSYFKSELNWRNLIRREGYEFDFISASDCSTKLGSFNVLVLPYSVSLSEKTSKDILLFAENGGIVIADVPPGTFDEHGRHLNGNGIWESVIKATDNKKNHPEDNSTTERRHGKGMLICLNEIPGAVGKGAETAAKALAEAQIGRPAYWEKGNLKNKYEQYLFTRGKAKYVGIIGMGMYANKRENPPVIAGDEEVATLHLDGKSHVYNVRTKEYLGHTDAIPLRLRMNRPEFFAMLPYKIEGVNAEAAVDRENGTLKYSVRCLEAEPDERLIRIEFTDPQGKAYEPYARKLWTHGGSLEDSTPLALNEKAGEWRISFIDVVSGLKDERSVKIGTVRE